MKGNSSAGAGSARIVSGVLNRACATKGAETTGWVRPGKARLASSETIEASRVAASTARGPSPPIIDDTMTKWTLCAK